MLDADLSLPPNRVQVSPSLIYGGDRGASVVLYNHSGLTCQLEKDQDLGTLEVVEQVTTASSPESTLTHARDKGRSYVKSSMKTRTFQTRPKDTFLSC